MIFFQVLCSLLSFQTNLDTGGWYRLEKFQMDDQYGWWDQRESGDSHLKQCLPQDQYPLFFSNIEVGFFQSVPSIPGFSLPAVFSFLYVLYSEFLFFCLFLYNFIHGRACSNLLAFFFYTSSYIYHTKEHTNAKNNPFFSSHIIFSPSSVLLHNW